MLQVWQEKKKLNSPEIRKEATNQKPKTKNKKTKPQITTNSVLKLKKKNKRKKKKGKENKSKDPPQRYTVLLQIGECEM